VSRIYVQETQLLTSLVV